MKRPRKLYSLVQHRAVLERTLVDVRAGRKIAHLSEEEIEQMINGLENRLADVIDSLHHAAPPPGES